MLRGPTTWSSVDRYTSTGWVTAESSPTVVFHIAGSVATDATGVRFAAPSCASGFLMSPPIDGTDRTRYFSTGVNGISGLSPASDGFTSTSPLTRLHCVSASRSDRQPPIEIPATYTWSQRAESSVNARSAAPYQ